MPEVCKILSFIAYFVIIFESASCIWEVRKLRILYVAVAPRKRRVSRNAEDRTHVFQ